MARAITIPPRTAAALEEYLHGLRDLYGDELASVVLFGSWARGDARVDSDIDVLVVLRRSVDVGREIELTSELRQQICLQHEVVISSLYVSEAELQNSRSPTLANIRREGVQL